VNFGLEWFAVEEPVEGLDGLGLDIEPIKEFFALVAVVDAPVELVAEVFRKVGDFTGAGFHGWGRFGMGEMERWDQ
jgi:hypothetical protein